MLYDEQLIKNSENSYARSQRAYLYFLLGGEDVAMKELNDMLKNASENIDAKSIKELIELQKNQG